MNNYCTNCGHELRGLTNCNYCPQCGNQVSLISEADTDGPIYPMPQYKVPAGQTWEGLQPDGSYIFEIDNSNEGLTVQTTPHCTSFVFNVNDLEFK